MVKLSAADRCVSSTAPGAAGQGQSRGPYPALVDPSLNRIARTIADDQNPALALAAARDILDRAGDKATEKIQSDGRTVIEIEYVDRPNALELKPSNGVDTEP